MTYHRIIKSVFVLLSALTLASTVHATDTTDTTEADQTRRAKLAVVTHVQAANRTVSRHFSGTGR